MTKLCEIWIEECETAIAIEAEFGTNRAVDYLVGEKFLDFLEAADDHPAFRGEIPAFVDEIKTLFEPWQIAEYLETARQSEPFDPTVYDDEETARLENERDIRKCAAELLLVERAKEWLLDEGE